MSAVIAGLLGKFDTPDALVQASKEACALGYREVDALTPFPVEGLAEALGMKRTGMPSIALLGGVTGLAGGYLLQYYVAVIDLPLRIAGKPLHSWPSFVQITFELGILFSALSIFAGLLALNRMPRYYHSLFNVEEFRFRDRSTCFLYIESDKDRFDRELTRDFLLKHGASEVYEVPA